MFLWFWAAGPQHQMFSGWIGRRALKAGDRIPVGASSVPEAELLNRSLPPAVYESQVTVRVIPGPQEEAFTENGLETFYSSSYTITPDSDRMGYRMDGPELKVSGEPTLSLTPLSLAPYRFPPPESRLSFWQTGRLQEAMPKSQLFFPWTCPGWCSAAPRYGKIFPNFCRRGQELSAQKGDIYEYIRHEA